MNRPLLILILAFILGIIIGTTYQIDIILAMGITVVACGLAIIGIMRTWRHNPWVLFCVFLCLGTLWTSLAIAKANSPVTTLAGKTILVVGEVLERPDVRPDGVFYKLGLSKVTVEGTTKEISGVLRVKVAGKGKVFHYGDILQMKGYLSLPEPPGNPGAFDYRTWLQRQGIAATLSVKDAKEIKLLGRSGHVIIRSAYNIRDHLENIFDRTMSQTGASVLKGIFFGTRGEIPADVQLAFQESGLVHILSVSGYHVGLIAAMVLALLRIIKLPRRFTLWVALPLLLFYAVMTGMGPAVMRATLMASLLLLAHHLGRWQDWPTTLAAAAGIILFFYPLDLFDIGFQLSFVATWGLLYLTPKLNKLLPHMPLSLAVLITVPLAAQLATWPLVVFYFNLVSPVAILANLITAHLVALVMLFGGLGMLAGICYLPWAKFINTATELLTSCFLGLVQMSVSLPGAAWYIPAPPLWLIALYYVFLVAICQLANQPQWQKSLRAGLTVLINYLARVKLVFGGCILLLLMAVWLLWPVNNQLELHFIDVGQGDSTLIITPAQRTILVDAGGWQDELITGQGAGTNRVVPYLHRLGINSLDVLVITHPHTDHAGGARAVLKAFPVKLVVLSPYGFGVGDEVDDGYEILLREMKEQGIAHSTAVAGDQLKVDGLVNIKFLSPAQKYDHTRSDANNSSLVFRLDYLQRSALYTGDIEEEAERDLVQNNALTPIEVLKVPHHGSGYFYHGFFAQLKPKIAVISAGAGNRFGHPAPKTLEELQGLGSRVYRTDQQGAIVLTTDGETWRVKTGK
ncbi:DNA internalization-related competence protein ComEC/Rec2 [Desulforamulus ferrireducens]|uniref:DNA internalization-related competence protein ComEC/Rec2 n=1 Tax=Desulforamulus ferrireducens TaxID=1833852 RepID=A0A1S6IYS2_9FIRM|nr:DNA internalization-related competence protein ComEC/Rec2 [Desulforamulus ferrireducens]AQS59924.1 DNA internalization-related competence protein ComEC/Rec2 [Desulforamulus ferrireducens]